MKVCVLKNKKFDELPKGKHGVLFSGGLDSTYILHNVLENNNNVIALKVDFNSCETTKHTIDVVENKATKDILDLLRVNYKVCLLNYLSLGGRRCINGESVWSRVPELAMITALAFAHCDIVHVGICMGDNLVSYIDEFIELVRLNVASMRYEIGNDRELILSLPLLKKVKLEIYSELEPSLKPNIWWCEKPREIAQDNSDSLEPKDPKYKPCGSCESCKRMRDIIEQIPVNARPRNHISFLQDGK